MGLCGAIPSGLKVLQKTGGTNTAPALYLNNKPCSVSADTQIQSSGSREGSSQVTAFYNSPCPQSILVLVFITNLGNMLARPPEICKSSCKLSTCTQSHGDFAKASQQLSI